MRATFMIAEVRWQRAAGLPQHAVKETPGFLDDFVKARQSGTRRTLLIMMTLHVFMASRTTLSQGTDFQYKCCALGLVAYMAIEGGFDVRALVKLYRDLRTWRNANFLICISMLLSRCIFLGGMFGAPQFIRLSQRLLESIALVAKSNIG
jgi:hypothetical protein